MGFDFGNGSWYSIALWRVAKIMPKIDFERLKQYSHEALSELDEAIKRNIRREADQKARELEEKLAKKKKKKRRKLQQQNNQ